jgi:Ran GTPase-activating protein (RanGAP) involved in mRNA processing and transport
MYGKNMMGAYKDKLSYEERWQVIHYIRGLQAKEKKLAYNETENTLNEWAIAGSMVKKMASTMDVEHAEHMEVEHSEQGDYEDGHSEDHGSQH